MPTNLPDWKEEYKKHIAKLEKILWWIQVSQIFVTILQLAVIAWASALLVQNIIDGRWLWALLNAFSVGINIAVLWWVFIKNRHRSIIF